MDDKNLDTSDFSYIMHTMWLHVCKLNELTFDFWFHTGHGQWSP